MLEFVIHPRRPHHLPPPHVFIHSTAVIDEDVTVGAGTKIWHFSEILPASESANTVTSAKQVVIGLYVAIGNSCKIQHNISVYKGVTLEDHVFCYIAECEAEA